jgi:hypothetical protein
MILQCLRGVSKLLKPSSGLSKLDNLRLWLARKSLHRAYRDALEAELILQTLNRKLDLPK